MTVAGGIEVAAGAVGQSMARRLDVLDGLANGYAWFDADGRLRDFNRGFLDVYLSLGEVADSTLRGMAFGDLLCLLLDSGEIAGDEAARDRQGWMAARLERFARPGAPHVERLADGRWMEIHEARTADGGTLVRWSDVTAGTAARMRLEDALESAGDGFALWDQRWRLMRCNQEFAARHAPAPGVALRSGVALRTVLLALAEGGRVVIDGTPETWVDALLAGWARPMAETVVEYADGRHYLLRCRRTRDGGMAMLLTDVTEMRAKERQLAERGTTLEHAVLELEMARAVLENQAADLVALAEDTALAQERAEEERRRAEATHAALCTNEAKLRAILGTIGDALLTIDDQGVVQSANPAAVRMFGWAVDEIVGRDVGLIIPDDAGGTLAHSLLTGEARTLGQTEERVARRRNGEAFPMELTVAEVSVDQDSGRHLFVATIRDITERKAAEEKLRHLATTDSLTGVANRRAFMDAADIALALAVRTALPLCVLACDIDHFKRINDTHGHAAGDDALRAFATAVRATLRKTDLLGRMGGEEFAILLPGTPLDRARAVAERIRVTVAALSVPVDGPESQPLHFTVSIGLGAAEAGEPVDELLRRADAALYAAKAGGRDRVEVAPPRPLLPSPLDPEANVGAETLKRALL